MYEAYGKSTTLQGDWTSRSGTLYAWRQRFQGLRYDGTGGGMYSVRHRDLNVTTSRWNQQDPLGYVDGANLYEFVGSEPTGTTDAGGLAALAPYKTDMLGKAVSTDDQELSPPRRKVVKASRRTNIPILKWLGFRHYWLMVVDENGKVIASGGMSPGPKGGYDTQISDHSKEVPTQTEDTGGDPDWAIAHLPPGNPTGEWSPDHECEDVVDDIVAGPSEDDIDVWGPPPTTLPSRIHDRPWWSGLFRGSGFFRTF